MAAPRKYPNELRERSQRMVAEAMSEDPALSLTAAVKRVGPRVGVNADTLRGWIRRSDIDAGRAPGSRRRTPRFCSFPAVLRSTELNRLLAALVGTSVA